MAEALEANDENVLKRAGWIIKITLPITARTSERVRRFAQNALDRAEEAGVEPVLIFEFHVASDQQNYAGTSEFGVSSDLARFISSGSLGGVTTVAYVPESIQGHAVLVVLACEHIAMAPGAEIGSAGVDHKSRIPPSVHSTYEEIARIRKIPPAIALGLVDPAKEVLQVETEVSREYVLAEELEELEKQKTVLSKSKVFDAGQPGQLTGKEARDLDLIDLVATDRREVIRMLELPLSTVEEDPSLVGEWKAVRAYLSGPINSRSVDRVQLMIEDAVRGGGANFVCLEIDSPGGSPADSMQLASFLVFDLDPSEVRTVAFVPSQALADASMVALACDQVVMQPEAILGGEGDYVFSEAEIDQAKDTLRAAITAEKSRSWSLPAAMIDPDLQVFRCTRQARILSTEYLCEEELAEMPDADQWQKGEEITKQGVPFRVNGERAVDYSLANEVVDDFAGFKELYGLSSDPALLEPGWANFVIEALAHPAMAVVLLLIGFSALYAELQAPGIGVGGFVALVCFVLFFWNGFLGGTAGWLEVMLFLAGVICLLLEFFVIPGFGIFGLGGGMLVIASLILASQTFVVPRNAYQMIELRNSFITLGMVAMGVMACVILINRWLPHVPIVGGMVLGAPSDEEAESISQRESLVHFEELVGSEGLTTTQLAPSGKARFKNRFVDVIADSEVIPPDTRIVVVEVLGNRVLVRPADEVK